MASRTAHQPHARTPPALDDYLLGIPPSTAGVHAPLLTRLANSTAARLARGSRSPQAAVAAVSASETKLCAGQEAVAACDASQTMSQAGVKWRRGGCMCLRRKVQRATHTTHADGIVWGLNKYHLEYLQLVSTGYQLLEPGGYLVYSTCSLNTKLNEGVIEALLHAEPSACLVPSFPNLPFEQITIRGVSSRCGVWNKIGSNEPKETWCHRLSPSASQWSQRWQRRQETN